MKKQNKKQHMASGTLCVFIAAICYSIGGLCIKTIPWNGISINGARNLVAIILVGSYLLYTGHRLRFNRYIALGAICVSGTTTLYALANKLTTAANTIVLQFTAPIWVILLSFLFWKRRPRKIDVAACVLLVIGVLCFFMDSLATGKMLGNALALLSGLTYSGVFLLNELPDGDPISSVFWGELLSILIGLPLLVQESTFTPAILACVLVLGAIQTGLAYILMCIGLKSTSAVTASLISEIEPILNPVLVAIVYGEQVSIMAFIGIIIVLGDVLGYNLLQGRKSSDN